jgi:hypothetical protein
MQHDTTDAAQSIKRGGTFRHFASLSEMHIRGTRNDESLASWPSVSPKADASAQGFGDHQYASDAVARKPAARHRFRPAASAARYEAKAGFENERIRHRFERCKLRGASHGPRRACRAAQALDVQDGPSNIDFFSSEARASRKENLQLN